MTGMARGGPSSSHPTSPPCALGGMTLSKNGWTQIVGSRQKSSGMFSIRYLANCNSQEYWVSTSLKKSM